MIQGFYRIFQKKGGCYLEYQEFVEQVKKSVEEQAKENVRVNVSRILKNNLEPVDGLTILGKGENVAKAIWLNPLYRRYEFGVPVGRIAEEILAYYAQGQKSGACDMSFYTDFEQAKDHIACKLIHRGMNESLLWEVPHRYFLDLAIVYYYKVEHETFGNASILIKNEHLRLWNTDPDALHALAMQNTLRIAPYEFMDLVELIGQMTEGDTDCFCRQEIPMFVLTNQEKNFGVAAILFPSVLNAVGERLQSDFFVLPSSIHECIVIPALDGIDPAALHEMVKEINEEHVAPEELLGDSVYRYDRNREELTIACQEM